MVEDLQRALREVRDTLLNEPVSPRVEEPRDINLQYCRYVAETVAERVGDDVEVEILEDGGRGYVHTWLRSDGRHYDAECVEGVDDYRQLPFFQRHPEAAVHVEPESTEPATLRHRGREPLYPALFAARRDDGPRVLRRSSDRTFAIASVLIGLAMLALGLAGEWVIQHHLVRVPSGTAIVLYDLELLGEVIVIVSPIVFFLIRPAHRASVRR